MISFWLKSITHTKEAQLKHELLFFILNIIKYSFKALSEENRKEIILLLCEISNTTTSVPVIRVSLECFEEIVTFSFLQTSCVPQFVATLCRTVNIERFSNISCNIMRSALQGCGYIGIQSLCLIIDDPTHKTTNLLRGAIFFLGK